MCFFTHAVVLGVGYWIGKQYSEGVTVRQLPIDPSNPNSQEFVIHVEKKDPVGFWQRSRCCQEHPRVEREEIKDQ
uniref:CX domain-containing protein n=1 Tax=Caenorhabditis tropicalis TaxID=1561998 RepID=A0A1I7UG72_9PELO